MKRALYIGKFQPFHIGHLGVVKYITDQPDVDEIIIDIGSAQWSSEKPNPERIPLQNPFSVEPRIEMISNTLKKEIKKPFHIIPTDDVLPIRDPNTIKVWRDNIIKDAPSFDVFYCNRGGGADVFKEVGKEIRPFPREYMFSATAVREKIARGEDWERFVPVPVAEYIKSKGSADIVKKLYGQTPLKGNSEWCFSTTLEDIPGVKYDSEDHSKETILYSAIATHADVRIRNNELLTDRLWLTDNGLEAREYKRTSLPMPAEDLADLCRWLRFPLIMKGKEFSESMTGDDFKRIMGNDVNPNLMSLSIDKHIYFGTIASDDIFVETEDFMFLGHNYTVSKLVSPDEDKLRNYVQRNGLNASDNHHQLLEKALVNQYGSDAFWNNLKID